MSRIQTYSAAEFVPVVSRNEGLLLVHCGSPLASSCEFVRKELEDLAPVFEDQLRLVEVEVPLQDVEILRRYAIEEIPTLILFRGDQEVERLERILLPAELKEFLDDCLSFYGGNEADHPLE